MINVICIKNHFNFIKGERYLSQSSMIGSRERFVINDRNQKRCRLHNIDGKYAVTLSKTDYDTIFCSLEDWRNKQLNNIFND